MKLRRSKSHTPLDYDETGPIYHYNERGQPVCGARKRKKDTVCMNITRMSPSGRCRIHGGAKNTGRPITKGLWSSALPKHLQENYEQALKDPNLGSMQESIALMDALIAEYLRGLTTVPPVETLDSVQRSIHGTIIPLLEECDGYPEELETELKKVAEKLEAVVKNRTEEQEVRRAIRERAELVRVEAQRIDKASKFVTVEQAMALVAALANTVNKYVTSESERVLVARAIDRLLVKGAVEEGESGNVLEADFEDVPESGQT